MLRVQANRLVQRSLSHVSRCAQQQQLQLHPSAAAPWRGERATTSTAAAAAAAAAATAQCTAARRGSRGIRTAASAAADARTSSWKRAARVRAVPRSRSVAAMAAGGDAGAGPLVTPEWLASRLGDPAVKVLDASWYLPNAGRDAKAEFAAARLPGARYFDLDAVSDASSDLPHMLPPPAAFGAACDALGVGRGDMVVVYDGAGVFSAPRVWWTFRVFGHPQHRVAVLDGGLPAWKALGLPLETAPPAEGSVEAGAAAAAAAAAAGGAAGGPTPSYQAVLQGAEVKSLAEVQAIAAAAVAGGPGSPPPPPPHPLVVDARPAARFRGEAPEPRPGVKGGHMPGAVNVPFDAVLQDGRFKSPEAICAAFSAAGALPAGGDGAGAGQAARPLVLSCGTGVTACVLQLALEVAAPDVQAAVYDGSWSEWGARDDTPIVT